MVSTSGSRLLAEDALSALTGQLLPLATLVTPNNPEAQVLTGMTITTAEDMEKAAQLINECYGCNVLMKGGHSINDSNDLLYHNGTATWIYGRRIDNPNTHGTGCTLSSAFAAQLAKGLLLTEAARAAKAYINNAIIYGAAYKIGNGHLVVIIVKSVFCNIL